MQLDSIFKHICSDRCSLVDYTKGTPPDFDTVKRRLFIMERDLDRSIPDHYYRIKMDKELDGIDSISGLLCIGLSEVAKKYLEFRGDRIYVKDDMQNQWQELITYIPPLVLQMAFLQYEHYPIMDKCSDILEYYNRYIRPYYRFTSLPIPYFPELEYIVSQSNGLHDLHIHLNGTIETDQMWLYSLRESSGVGTAYAKALETSEYVKEQWEQEVGNSDIRDMSALLIRAKNIRFELFKLLFDVQLNDEKSGEEDRFVDPCNINDLFSNLEDNPLGHTNSRHPFADLVYSYDEQRINDLEVEGLMYSLVFAYLRKHSRDSVAYLFHYYLLLQGMSNRLIVQQMHQKGFTQFQKITVNDIRYHLEKQEYLSRYRQLHGNNQCNIRYLEGRFSPKDNVRENIGLLNRIDDDWKKFLKEDSLKQHDKNILRITKDDLYASVRDEEESINTILFNGERYIKENPSSSADLHLVAHFIKKKDSGDNEIRHYSLRTEIWNKAKALAEVKNSAFDVCKRIVGIDAASSELDASPEVFAPSYRYLRRHGFNNFTYHAGEEFHHLIGGMRAIYEAIDFCDLRDGDRIGHACAAGLDPKNWIHTVGDRIYIKRGMYLDDLIFAYHLIVSEDDVPQSLKDLLPQVRNKIQELAFPIYGIAYSVEVLIKGWQLRKFCPILFLCDSKDDAMLKSVFDDDEWCAGDKEKKHQIISLIAGRESIKSIFNNGGFCDGSDENKDQILAAITGQGSLCKVESLVAAYHDKCVRKQYDEIMDIKTQEIFKAQDLEALQLLLLEYMTKKGIVIESLPTSNVRIGHYINYDTYHLWRWYQWHKEGHAIPAVVLGTDDPGIFATNIYNEYANVMCNLIQTQKLSRTEALSIIKQLDENGHIYKFKDPTPPDCQY